MNDAKALSYTKNIFILSLVLSIGSLFTSYLNLGNIYPFFSWKLYSQPLGTQKVFKEFRIYSKMETEHIYYRNSIKEIPTFTTDEYVYTLNYFVEKTIAEPHKYKWRLLKACKHLVPNANHYKIILESYDPKDLYSKNSTYNYDTTTVVTF